MKRSQERQFRARVRASRPVGQRARIRGVFVLGVGMLVVAATLSLTRSQNLTAAQADQAVLTEAGSPEAYWLSVSDFGMYGYRYSSLAEIVADSHLIVRGRLVGSVDGTIQSFEENPLHKGLLVTFGVVAIDEVLKGVPASEAIGTILVARLGRAGVPESALPKEDVILFLKNYAQMRLDEGTAASADPRDRYYYARPNGYQGLLRVVDGRVAVIQGPSGWEDSLGPFPSELGSRPIDQLFSGIAELVDAASTIK